MFLFCYVLYDSVWFSSPLFCPFSRCFFPMPKIWLLLLSIFHLFSLSPAGRQMGDMLLGTENVMERFSSHPTMRTDCSCNISLQIEGERSGVPNGTFLRLLVSWIFSRHSEKSSKSLVEIYWYRVNSLDLSPFVFYTFISVVYQVLDLATTFLFHWGIERQMWKNSWLVLLQYKTRALKTQNVLSSEKDYLLYMLNWNTI